MQDITVKQHPIWNGIVLNCPVQGLPSEVSTHQLEHTQDKDNYIPCLALLLHHMWLYHFYNTITLISAHHSLRSHSSLKMVFGKIGNTYQAYCNTYKTHAMATYHGGSGRPLDRDIDMTREAQKTTDTNIEDTWDFSTAETDHFADLEYNNPTKLTAVTRK